MPRTKKTTHSHISPPILGGIKGGKSGFTLVELIVTITIIAILGAIAFTAFNGFQSGARDSSRSADLANLSQALDTYYVKIGSYPNPDNAFTVTYSGGSLWYQGTVGDTLINTLSSNGSKLSKKPTDPLNTTKEYTYSRSAYGNTYELSIDWEGDRIVYSHPNNSLIPQAFAASGNPTITYIKGNYNGMVAKTITGSIIYVIATPSITTSTGTVGSNIDVTTLSGKLLYHGQTNSGGIAYTPTLVYSSGALPSNDDAGEITLFTTNLQTAYTGSVISSNSNIQNVLTTTGTTNITSLGANIITNYLGGSASAPPPPPATSYSLSNSLLFDSASSQYLSRTPTTVGNRKKWTWSGWVKRGIIDGTQILWEATDSIGTTVRATNRFATSSFIGTDSSTGLNYATSGLYRDSSSWYHIVMMMDTTQTIDINRFKLYINGQQINSFSSITYPTLNSDSLFSSNLYFNYIGATRPAFSQYFDGYLADVNFVDSGALDPTAFGYTDPTTNQWLPKQYTGTYGTNGFHLDFSSGATVASLGADSSGNNNTWTVNGISTVANNQVIDTPLNNFATLNPIVRRSDVTTPTTFSKGNLKAFHPDASGSATYTFGTTTMSSGKWYWENTIVNLSNVIVFGIDTGKRQALSNTETLYYQSDTGNKVVYGTSSVYGSTFTTNDVIGVALDMDNLQITFYKNNVSQGTITGLSALSYVPIGQGNTLDSYTTNFGQGGQAGLTNYSDAGGYFKYAPPTGFKALSTANLPTPTIQNPKQYFDVLTYVGNHPSSQTFTGLAFSPDLVWIKGRDYADFHTLYDTVRGVTKSLSSEQTTAEVTRSTALTAFGSNGFSLGGDTVVNYGGHPLVAWNWKAGGTAVANNNGTIASQISANPTAGFSIVSYTGNGINGATVGHGLSQTPEFIIEKGRDSAFAWTVQAGWAWPQLISGYSGWQNSLFLNSTGSVNPNSGNGAPDSAKFKPSALNYQNESTKKYIAYVFHSVPGYSKFGTYVGNGSADGPFVYTGFRPRYVMWKRTDTIGGAWFIYDAVRSTTNIMGEEVYANDPGIAGVTTRMDFVSNGFKLRAANPGDNASGGTYIYAAFAEAPFKYANAR